MTTQKLSPGAKALKRALRKPKPKLVRIRVHGNLVFDLNAKLETGDLYGIMQSKIRGGEVLIAKVSSVKPFHLEPHNADYELRHEGAKKLGKLNSRLDRWKADAIAQGKTGQPEEDIEYPDSFMSQLGSIED
jgi:hypothetical protein